jgi:hypothetical protein
VLQVVQEVGFSPQFFVHTWKTLVPILYAHTFRTSIVPRLSTHYLRHLTASITLHKSLLTNVGLAGLGKGTGGAGGLGGLAGLGKGTGGAGGLSGLSGLGKGAGGSGGLPKMGGSPKSSGGAEGAGSSSGSTSSGAEKMDGM